MGKSIFCIADSAVQADDIVTQLREAGFALGDVSLLVPDKSRVRDLGHEQHTKASEGAATGAATGGILGGTLGLLAGIGTLAIPGAGPFIAAGPIMAALSGMAAGAAVGGLTGGLIGLGMPEYEAKRYVGKIHGGNILLAVHVRDKEAEGRCKHILEACNARDISTAGEGEAPRPKAS